MNFWAANFFSSAEILTEKRYLKVNGVETIKRNQPAKWILICLIALSVTYVITALIPMLFNTLIPRPSSPAGNPPYYLNMGIANLSQP